MSPARNKTIPLSEPCLEGNEWRYVKECLDSNWVSTAGSFVNRFENDVADCVGANHAVAVASGTAALHTALMIAGVEPGDEVLVSTLTFIASANAIRYVGAYPVFIDAEPRYWQMDPNLVEHFLATKCHWKRGTLRNRETGRRVRAIMPVHILGHPVEMDAVVRLAKAREMSVIEDAAESLGATYRGGNVGTLGDVACFSFNGNKTITAGSGGMIVTNQQKMAAKARYLTTQAKDVADEYVHHEVGYNYRMPNILAAIGTAQLEVLPKYISAKRRIAASYFEDLSGLPGVNVYSESGDARSTYWLTALSVDQSLSGTTARELREHLRQQGIESRPLWQPLHASPAHRGAPAMLTGVADALYQECLCIPSSANLPEEDRRQVVSAVANHIDQSQARARAA